MNTQQVRNVREEAAASGATTLIYFVYDRLRHDIIAGAYPPKEKLRVEYLRNSFGVAASTVREALGRLAAEGLVTAEGQRGFRVAPMSRDDLMDITRLRVLLETEAFVESIRNGDVAWECQVVAAFHNLTRAEERIRTNAHDDLVAWEETNKEFHRALTAACRSTRLLDLVEILYRQHERYRMQSLMSRRNDAVQPVAPSDRNVHSEHEALMNAALDRDVDRARKVLADHIGNTADLVGRNLNSAA
jgi:DNA-binding GntR family transcriptional regulator